MARKTKAPKVKGRERFATFSIGDPAFAAWFLGASSGEAVTPTSILALSAVQRAVQVIAGPIAGLPLRTYERHGDERERIESVFDDPYPGADGMTGFEWVETVVLHELLYRDAFLWHEDVDRGGYVSAFRPLLPSTIEKVERVAGRKRFTYHEDGEERVVGTDLITHIPGPSLDGLRGHPMILAARAMFSGALSGDKAAQNVLNRGIRIAGIMTPEDSEEDLSLDDAKVILEDIRQSAAGPEHAGDISVINRRLKLTPWPSQSNAEAQWHETRREVLGDVGRIFGVPPHLLNDTEKQTSWGTGVAEQTLNFARFTLMGWTSRIEQRLTQKLPRGQFVEFDYKGLLQGTPLEEIGILLDQINAGLIDIDEARRVLNLPPRTPAQVAAEERRTAPPRPALVPQEATA